MRSPRLWTRVGTRSIDRSFSGTDIVQIDQRRYFCICYDLTAILFRPIDRGRGHELGLEIISKKLRFYGNSGVQKIKSVFTKKTSAFH